MTSIAGPMLRFMSFLPCNAAAPGDFFGLSRLTPLVTAATVPNGELVGLTAIYGITRKRTLLESVLLGNSTATNPVVAPLGTLALISVLERTVNVAAAPLKLTPVAPVSLFPRILTAAPTSPEAGSVSTKGPSPTERLKTVPQSLPLHDETKSSPDVVP